MTDEDYSKAPISINEAKQEKGGDADHWTPRELLVRMLREIDNGNGPQAIIIVTRYEYQEYGYDDYAHMACKGARTTQSCSADTFKAMLHAAMIADCTKDD